MNLNKIIILLIAFLDILAIGIFVPTLPDLSIYFGVTANQISYTLITYALFSFLTGPILGQLSDIFGRKKILILCIIGSLVSNIIIFLTGSYLIFIIARIINGITGGNISILSSMLSDISENKNERMHNMGLIGALFGMGFIIGPFIGGLLLPFGVKAPFLLMTIATVIELIIVLFLLKETNKNKKELTKINYNPFSSIKKYILDQNLKLFIISFFILLISFSLYQGMFPVFLSKEFGVPGYLSGYILCGVGIVIAFNQMFLLKRFWLKYFSLKKLFFIINIGILLLFILLFFITNLIFFLIIFFILVIFAGVVNPIYQSEIVEYTNEKSRGEIMGVMGSLQSISMFIGPLIGGICIDKNISMFGIGAIFVFLNIFLVINLVKKIKK